MKPLPPTTRILSWFIKVGKQRASVVFAQRIDDTSVQTPGLSMVVMEQCVRRVRVPDSEREGEKKVTLSPFTAS